MLLKSIRFLSDYVREFFRLPFMQELRRKHPQIFGFLARRLTLRHFTGLPLLLLIGVFVFNAILLTQIAEKVVNSDAMKQFDADVSQFFFKARNPVVVQILYGFTQLCGEIGVVLATALGGGFLLFLKRKTYAIIFFISSVGSALSLYLTKITFMRERPLDIGFYKETSFSFPSGHSTAAVTVYGLIFFLIFMNQPTFKRKTLVTIAGFSFVLLMGFSRIYLGVHFLSDVAAGFLLGSLWLLASISIGEFLESKARRDAAKSSAEIVK
jgi:undecaprenyl-diphosphatase